MLYLMENEHMTSHKVMVADSSSLPMVLYVSGLIE